MGCGVRYRFFGTPRTTRTFSIKNTVGPSCYVHSSTIYIPLGAHIILCITLHMYIVVHCWWICVYCNHESNRDRKNIDAIFAVVVSTSFGYINNMHICFLRISSSFYYARDVSSFIKISGYIHTKYKGYIGKHTHTHADLHGKRAHSHIILWICHATHAQSAHIVCEIAQGMFPSDITVEHKLRWRRKVRGNGIDHARSIGLSVQLWII